MKFSLGFTTTKPTDMLKQILIIASFLFCIQNGQAQGIIIPDTIFNNYLVENPFINTNMDAIISPEEAASFSGFIDVNGMEITDLSGIENFTNLVTLRCQDNAIASLDLSANTALEILDCSNNGLHTLSLPEESALVFLNFNYNLITTIDLSGCNDLTYLFGQENAIAHLDVSNCSSLSELTMNSNALETINLNNGNNASLYYFNLTNNLDLDCIQVDDLEWSNSNWTGGMFSKDPGAQFKESCFASVIETDLSFSIYPNPAQDFIIIENSVTTESFIEIYDLQGALVLTTYLRESNKEIPIGKLATGRYILKHISNNQVSSQCFTKL